MGRTSCSAAAIRRKVEGSRTSRSFCRPTGFRSAARSSRSRSSTLTRVAVITLACAQVTRPSTASRSRGARRRAQWRPCTSSPETWAAAICARPATRPGGTHSSSGTCTRFRRARSPSTDRSTSTTVRTTGECLPRHDPARQDGSAAQDRGQQAPAHGSLQSALPRRTSRVQVVTCYKDAEVQDGLGLPGHHHCGDPTLTRAEYSGYVGARGTRRSPSRGRSLSPARPS